MTRKRKKLLCTVSLIAGISVFGVAAFASYVTQSGYSVLKKALINTIGQDNYTMELNLSMCYEDIPLGEEYMLEKYSEEHKALSRIASYDKENERYVFINGSTEIDIKNGEARIFDVSYRDDDYYMNNSVLNRGIDPDEEEGAKMIRFMELLADTLIGDIKNNFVYVSGNEEIDSYELKLSSVQIPELFNAGISALFSSQGEYYADADSPDAKTYRGLGSSPYVSEVVCEFDVDKENRIRKLYMSAVLTGEDENGEEHSAVMKYDGKLWDYGITVPDTVDLSSVKVVYRQSTDNTETETELAEEITIQQ